MGTLGGKGGKFFFPDFFLIYYSLRQWGTHGESFFFFFFFFFGGGGERMCLEGANCKKKIGGKISKIGKKSEKNSTENGLNSIGNSKKSL